MLWNPFLMKKLLKSEICGSINSAQMHYSLWKSQSLQLMFNEQCMNSNRITPKRVKTTTTTTTTKKKKRKEKRREERNVKIKRRRSKSRIQTVT